MSADSTATSDASDPGSPFSHTSTSTCTDDSAGQKISSTTSLTSQQKALKRQAQVTEKCDKKRAKKELCSKNNNVEIKLIPLTAPTANHAQVKKATPKSILSPITNNNVKKTAIINPPPPPIVIPTPQISHQQPPSLASLTSTPIGVSAINKLTDYFKLKKDPAKLNEYCNILLNLQSGAKQNNSKSAKTQAVAATTITPVTQQHQQQQVKINSTIAASKKVTNEKKTAKIAPIIPVARKNTTTQSSMAASVQQPVKISPKKPVSIAPRIVDTPKTTKNAPLQPKPMSMSVANGKAAASNGKLIASNNTPSSNAATATNAQNSTQPTVLLAAIRIPNQMQPSTQPPPLKIQNGLIQKTTTTTTTTKLAPLLQFHTQPMIPNLIQFQPNLIAAANKQNSIGKANNASTNAATQNLIVNNGQLTHQQQQQLFMNGAVIKLQPLPTSQSQSQQQQHSTVTSSTAMNAAQKFAIQQQQQAFTAQLTAQHMQQLFMTTPVLFNTSSIPTVLTSQLAGLQHAFNQQQISTSMAPPSTIPALQPIQSSILSSSTFASSSLTSTTNSLQLPSFSTLLHNQQLQNIQIQQQPMMKQFASSLPPSLTITSGFLPSVTQQQQQQQMTAKVNPPPQATIAPSQKAPPPLAPASNHHHHHPINLPKLISVSSSASQTSPKSLPPPLVINQKVSLPQGSPIVTKVTSIKQEELKPANAICVVPPLPSPAKLQPIIEPSNMKVEIETQETITVTETKDSTKSAISIVVEEKSTIECAKSPILSQPKTIRFPPVNGKVTVWKKCVKISKTGVCNWEKCSKHFDSNADLLEHLHCDHINGREEGAPYMCSWRDCKVNGREGSKGWLERHVMSHVGSKPFKCIVERCGLRFSTQVS
jgi:hypothetical protein